MTFEQLVLLWVGLAYFSVGTIIGFSVMAIDKHRAHLQLPRISETTLVLLIGAGAALGIIAGGRLFRHKTRKINFQLKGLIGGGGLLAVNLTIWYLLWLWLA